MTIKYTSNSIVKKIFTGLILIGVFLCFYIFGKIRTNEIKTHLRLCNGYVYETSIQHRGWVNLAYEFQVNGKRFKELKVLGVPSTHRKMFLDRNFPVVYSLDNIDFNDMLIVPEDFQKYNISFPDSLNWVIKYLK